MLRRLLPVVLLAATPALSACLGDEPTIALLVADGSSQSVDADLFTARVDATCDECRVRVYDAGGDADTQRSQVRQAQADSADVLVVEPVAGTPDATNDLPLVSVGGDVDGADAHVGLEEGQAPAGSGSTLDEARAVLLGEERSMTYVPTREMSDQAADVAVGLLAGAPRTDGEDVDGVPSWLFADEQVTVDTLTSVLVAQGVVTLAELCSGETEKRCERFGLR
ncbi:hypothetical protein [Nocardioides zeicaulis]|uniref:Substrate-binding domain-containing protein n=1 Tax=Nocardioides zeicaulis TaxID=1776857 RepID=A0ABV6E699_9ACTN